MISRWSRPAANPTVARSPPSGSPLSPGSPWRRPQPSGEAHRLEAVAVRAPAADDGSAGGTEREAGSEASSRASVAGDDQRVTDRPGRQEPVGDLQAGEHAARAVGHVEREGAVAAAVRVLGVGADVLLDKGGEGRLAHVAVVVEADVDEQVDVAGVETGLPPGALAALIGERVGGPSAPTTAGAGDRDRVNRRSHGTSPTASHGQQHDADLEPDARRNAARPGRRPDAACLQLLDQRHDVRRRGGVAVAIDRHDCRVAGCPAERIAEPRPCRCGSPGPRSGAGSRGRSRRCASPAASSASCSSSRACRRSRPVDRPRLGEHPAPGWWRAG